MAGIIDDGRRPEYWFIDFVVFREMMLDRWYEIFDRSIGPLVPEQAVTFFLQMQTILDNLRVSVPYPDDLTEFEFAIQNLNNCFKIVEEMLNKVRVDSCTLMVRTLKSRVVELMTQRKMQLLHRLTQYSVYMIERDVVKYQYSDGDMSIRPSYFHIETMPGDRVISDELHTILHYTKSRLQVYDDDDDDEGCSSSV